jgi:hypothetical protein
MLRRPRARSSRTRSEVKQRETEITVERSTAFESALSARKFARCFSESKSIHRRMMYAVASAALSLTAVRSATRLTCSRHTNASSPRTVDPLLAARATIGTARSQRVPAAASMALAPAAKSGLRAWKSKGGLTRVNTPRQVECCAFDHSCQSRTARSVTQGRPQGRSEAERLDRASTVRPMPHASPRGAFDRTWSQRIREMRRAVHSQLHAEPRKCDPPNPLRLPVASLRVS